MLVHRLLDVVFRTLDAIDAVRARVDAVIGHDAQPPSTWPLEAPAVSPPPSMTNAPSTAPTAAPSTVSSTAPSTNAPAAARPASPAKPGKREARHVVARGLSTTKRSRNAQAASSDAAEATAARAKRATASTTATASKAAASTATAANEKPAKKATPTKAKAKAPSSSGDSATPRDAAGVGRKGSVDRSGRDLESPRARAIETWLKEQGRPLVADDAALDGKRTLARVLWAVACAEDAGSEQGLTAADASALLSSAAGVEVFTTNVGRTFRDESALFVETIPDGRSKRYKLTAVGRARLAEIRTR